MPSHFSSHLGGSEYQVKLILNALCETNKYDIHYLCKRFDEKYIAENYRIHCLNNWRKWSRSLFSFLAASEIYTELKKIKPSIIYQRVGGVQTGVAAYYAKKEKIKLIWHISSDNDIAPQWKGNIKQSFLSTTERMFLNYGIKNASMIIAQTKNQKKLLEDNFKIKTNIIIPNGHPVPKECMLKSEKINVIWVANLKPLKRPELFIRVAEHFRASEDVNFIMIGRQGWGRWYQKILHDIKKLPKLKYLGELTQEQVNQILCVGHILVNTSRYEGFSNTFIQAWMRKIPVVSLTVDPDHILVKEKIGFHSRSFMQLLTDIKTLIQNRRIREQMGERAFFYAQKNHTEKQLVFKFINLLDKNF